MSFATALDFTCELTGISPEEMLGPSQEWRFAHPRFAIIWALRSQGRLSYPQIGERMNRHHTSIINGYKRACHLRECSPEFRALCNKVASSLCGHRMMRAGDVGFHIPKLRRKPIPPPIVFDGDMWGKVYERQDITETRFKGYLKDAAALMGQRMPPINGRCTA